MMTELIVYLLISTAILAVIVFQHWYEGSDLKRSDFLGMVLIAFIPVINVIALVVCFALILGVVSNDNKIMMKGRVHNDERTS